jgi:hypothetical protein
MSPVIVSEGVGPDAVASAATPTTVSSTASDGVGPDAVAVAATPAIVGLFSTAGVGPEAVATAAAGTVTVVSPPTDTDGVGPDAVAAAAVGPTSMFTFVNPADAVAAAAAGLIVDDRSATGVGPAPVAAAAAAGLITNAGRIATNIAQFRAFDTSCPVQVPTSSELVAFCRNATAPWMPPTASVPIPGLFAFV